MGGQGKSQVALEYCRRSKNKPYSAIIWINAESEESVRASFAVISERIKTVSDVLPDTAARIAFVLHRLGKWGEPWLMVFDNYDDPVSFYNVRDYMPEGQHGHVLVTSRHMDTNELVDDDEHNFIELVGLDIVAASKLLLHHSRIQDRDESEVKKALERLGYHALAITQAAIYIKKRRLSLSEFWSHFEQRKRVILETTPQLSQYRRKLGQNEKETALSVFTTWELSFQQLESQTSRGAVEATLLTLLAFFNHIDISEAFFMLLDRCHHSGKSDQLASLSKALYTAQAQWDQHRFQDILITLHGLSLIQSWEKDSNLLCCISLHPLVQDWIRLRAGHGNDYEESVLIVAKLVKEAIARCWHDVHFVMPLNDRQTYLLHVRAQEGNLREWLDTESCQSIDDQALLEYVNCQDWFGFFLLTSGIFALAERIQLWVIETRKRVQGQEHPDTLISMNNLASTYLDQGQWKEAEELGMQTMEMRKRVLGQEHPHTLISMNNLVSTYMNQGRWKEAEELGMQTMETRKRVLGQEHPDMLRSMNILALMYMNQGWWKEAEELGMQTIEIRKRVLGQEHPDTLTSINNLVVNCLHQGQWKKAEELGMQTIEIRKRVLGQEHPDTLTSINNLVVNCLHQGQWKKAEELGMQTIETRKRVLGQEHPDTLTSMNILASTYMNQGRWKEAEELGMQTMETRKRLLGQEHPDTLISMHNLARIWKHQGHSSKALVLMAEVVQLSKNVKGENHPETETSAKMLEEWQAQK
ncbi:hypothetical protein EPUS_08198 [Endocarpon pusillum Z07020]|uniref:NB-ARC domain-containing protein n=1 Tax=Endocarpon pusillum (strain Z07020 / HMAS-L-300199) TaxID=1263415 RepID=U1HJ69_ENDPU|nr:uncharacterized protein EPUS_08198 [Endocarpon pusillum Z07020]ERF68964.1 hypothetical protein EPUS_08198 [Endocarpon pusillum Z07020]